jgi:hypothetical protein
MVSHKQFVLEYCVLQYPELLQVLNNHENCFAATITKKAQQTTSISAAGFDPESIEGFRICARVDAESGVGI